MWKILKNLIPCWRWIFSGWLCICLHERGVGVCACTNVDACMCAFACMAHVCACTCAFVKCARVWWFKCFVINKKRKNCRMILTIFSFPDTHQDVKKVHDKSAHLRIHDMTGLTPGESCCTPVFFKELSQLLSTSAGTLLDNFFLSR